MENLKVNPLYSTHRNLHKTEPAIPNQFTGTETGGLRKKGFGKKDSDEKPLLSIIMVVKNEVDNIGESIESAIHQSYGNIELIILDGGSEDGTVKIIRKYEDFIDFYISAPDNGIYDAMNKGLALAGGRYVHFLNSGDHYLHQRAAEIVIDMFKTSRKRWIHANVLMLDKQKGKGWIRYSDVSRFYYLFKGIPQQAFFFERSLFEECGNFDEQYKIVADLDFLLRIMLKNRIAGKYLNMPVVVFNTGGVSRQMVKKKAEREKVLKKYFPGWTLILIKNQLFSQMLVHNEVPRRKKSLLEKLMSLK